MSNISRYNIYGNTFHSVQDVVDSNRIRRRFTRKISLLKVIYVFQQLRFQILRRSIFTIIVFEYPGMSTFLSDRNMWRFKGHIT